MSNDANQELDNLDEIHASKDNEAEWGEPIAATSRKRLNAVVSVRFNPDELEQIRGAMVDGNISQFIREATLKAAMSQPMRWSPIESLNSSVQASGGSIVINSRVQFSDGTLINPNLCWEPPVAKSTV